jgi:hypothetical protein
VADLFGRFRKTPADTASATGPLDAWLARSEDEESIWRDLVPGPPIDALSSRLSTMPGAFFDEVTDVVALAGDLELAAADPTIADILAQAATSLSGRRAAAAALWLWASEDVVESFEPTLRRDHAGRALAALVWRLAPVIDPTDWLIDAQRREETVRLFLLWSGQLPAGEDVPTARALWDRIDSLKRNSALQTALADHQHRLAVLAQLQANAAAEAAARYTHE